LATASSLVDRLQSLASTAPRPMNLAAVQGHIPSVAVLYSRIASHLVQDGSGVKSAVVDFDKGSCNLREARVLRFADLSANPDVVQLSKRS
jgi:hypothetical protein